MNYKKCLKYDITKKICIIDDITETIFWGNNSILKLFVWHKKVVIKQ